MDCRKLTGLFLQGLKLSDGATRDVSQASDHTKSAKELAPEFKERRRDRNAIDRRKTRNPVFEARARRVGMALDRRQSSSSVAAGVTALFSGDATSATSKTDAAASSSKGSTGSPGWGFALRERCASWFRPLRESWTSEVSTDTADPIDTQASNAN